MVKQLAETEQFSFKTIPFTSFTKNMAWLTLVWKKS